MKVSKELVKILQVRISVANVREKRTTDVFLDDRDILVDIVKELSVEEVTILRRTNTIISFLDAEWITYHDIYTGAEITFDREEN